MIKEVCFTGSIISSFRFLLNSRYQIESKVMWWNCNVRGYKVLSPNREIKKLSTTDVYYTYCKFQLETLATSFRTARRSYSSYVYTEILYIHSRAVAYKSSISHLNIRRWLERYKETRLCAKENGRASYNEICTHLCNTLITLVIYSWVHLLDMDIWFSASNVRHKIIHINYSHFILEWLII